MSGKTRRWKAGDLVEVRSRQEILRTLDENGQLDGMPFMPEMFAFCGGTFKVFKRAHKTCDTVFPVRSRRVDRAVHLETRCNGEAHGGCQAGCLLFWKEAWLKPVGARSTNHVAPSSQPQPQDRKTSGTPACAEQTVWDRAQLPAMDGEPPTYVCQATRLPYATTDLAWWDLRQYIEDYSSGNVSLWRLFCGFVYSMYYNLSVAGLKIGRPMRWFYNTFHSLWGASKFPRNVGPIPEGQPTPAGTPLDLQPGELVRVKSHDEILQTVNTASRNRGLLWDAEMVPYCEGTYRVLKRVTKIINESTGKMQEFHNPCIILDSVICKGLYSGCRMFCPRSIYPYWREIWLERLGRDALDAGQKATPHSIQA
jgi:hypothetical protein